MRGFGSVKCRLAGRRRCLSDSAALISPAMPEAASRWPMLVFTEPTRQGAARVPAVPSTSPRAPASIGSPTGVPVPCAST